MMWYIDDIDWFRRAASTAMGSLRSDYLLLNQIKSSVKTVWIILSQPATKVAVLEGKSVWAMAGRKLLSVVHIGADCNEKSAADTMNDEGGGGRSVCGR